MKQKKRKRYILKYLILILIIVIIFIFIRMELHSNIVAVEVPESNQIIIQKESFITEESSFPDNVYGVPVYTELIDINKDTRPRN